MNSMIISAQKDDKIRPIIVFIAASLSSISLSIDKTYIAHELTLGQRILTGMNGKNLLYIVLFIFLYSFYLKSADKYRDLRKNIVFAVLAAILGLICMVGDGFSYNGNLTYLFADSHQIILCLIVYLGYVIFFYAAVSVTFVLFVKYHKKSAQYSIQRSNSQNNTKIRILCYSVFFLICWLPYLIAYFPGSIPHDGMTQIAQAMGSYMLINDHPIVSTFYAGVFVRIGRFIGNDNLGIFLGVLFQTILIAVIFALIVNQVYQYTGSLFLARISLVILGIYPTWGMMVQSYIKDTLYVGFFALFFMGYTHLLLFPEAFFSRLLNVILLVIGMAGMCFWRNNGMHILLASVVCICVSKLEIKKKLWSICSFAAVIIIYMLVVNIAYPAMGIPETSNSPEINIMLQQTARYMYTHSDEVTKEERQTISKVIDYEYVLENYDPECSDYAKKTYNVNISDSDWDEYKNVWFEMLKKHPETYIEATLNTTYNYYYFGDNRNVLSEYQNYTKYEVNYDLPGLIEDNGLGWFKNILDEWADFLKTIPIFGILGRCGVYFWVLCIFSAFFVRMRWRNKLIALAPLWLNTLLFCVLSPVNGLQRYQWPVMALLPCIFGIAFEKHSREWEHI